VVYDVVGGDAFDACSRAMAWNGKVKVHVDEVFPLDKAVDAMQKVMGRKVKGKVILKP